MNAKNIFFIHLNDFYGKKIPTATFILRGKSEKYTKENMLKERFGSHFSQNGPFN